ncbi:MAG: ornithine cyclodeaminase family protein [Phycisphaerae bacterium]|nr:ornithine cyclodeaminase family protein [Phycisphaerae bacterium]
MATFLSQSEIEALCTLEEVIATQREVFARHARAETVLGPRAVLTQGENAQFSYIARASSGGPTIVKFGTVVPSNAQRGLPAVQTTVAVLDAETGSPTHFFDGETVTRLRTVATSMAVANTVTAHAKRIAIVGIGHQGLAHATAAREIFQPLELIGISRQANSSCAGDSPFTSITSDISSLDGFDLAFLCTNSMAPVLSNPLAENSLVVSIGSFAPNRSEISPELLSKADHLFVDDPAISIEQCGSVRGALAQATRSWTEPRGIGSLFHGPTPTILGRSYFFSVGLGIQDAALVELLLKKMGR